MNHNYENHKITWTEFAKFIGITVALLGLVTGGMQFYFSSKNNISERLLKLEERVKTIETNDLKHINMRIKDIRECQDRQEKKIDKIEKTTTQILERIK